MLRRSLLAGLLILALAGASVRRASAAGHGPYGGAFGAEYADAFRYVPYPINAPYSPYKVPVYMYGFFGAQPRHEPKRNQGFNYYIYTFKRGYTR